MSDVKNNLWKFFDHFCIIERSAIGVCCPNDIIERNNQMAIELPASGNDHVEPWQVQDEENGEANRNDDDDEQERGCGVATKQFPKITGGRPADPQEYPWMAALISSRKAKGAFCGGVLITDRHVLSAAHCSNRIRIQDLFVRLGEYSFEAANETRSRDFRVEEIRQHVDFDMATYENDIAILKILRAAVFNSYIWPICMPPLGDKWEGKKAIVVGWGTQFFGGPHSDILMEVTVPVWNNTHCQSKYAHRILETVICAGETGLDSCQGDSGGPLMVQLPNNRWTVVGIVSWGVRCGEEDHPGIYTRVSEYIQWIIENATF
jgi:serine protease 56